MWAETIGEIKTTLETENEIWDIEHDFTAKLNSLNLSCTSDYRGKMAYFLSLSEKKNYRSFKVLRA